MNKKSLIAILALTGNLLVDARPNYGGGGRVH